MSYKMISMSVLTASCMALSTVALAAEKSTEAYHDGKVVSVSADKLVMTAKGDKTGKEHSHSLAKDAKFTLDGKSCKWSDIKAGIKIRVTTESKDSKVAVNVEAIDKQELFANTHDGTVVSVTKDKLVMKDKDGKEHTHALSTDTKLTCDGEVCKVADLEAGMMIRVTTEKSDENSVICIEALKTETEFASI